MPTRQMLCRPCFTKQWLTLACVRYSEKTSTPCSTRCTVQQVVKSTFQLTPTEFSNQAQQITDSYGKIIFDRNAKADKTTEEPQTEEPKNEDPQPEAKDQQTEKGERTNAPAKESAPVSEEDTKFQWSKERALNGEPFLIGKNGSIDLVIIPNEVLAKIGLEKVPFRLTPSMIAHVYERHKKELKLHSKADAVEAILDVMNNFDHVRMGERDNTFVFSIEGNRTASARRAITFVLEYDRGKWIGIKTVGYDRVSDIKELTTLWEKGEKTSATGVATANVTSEQPLQGDRADGIASNQSAVISTHKDTPSNQDSQDNKHENKEALSEDTVGGSPVALAYLLEGGVGSILNAGYFLHGVAAAYPHITNDIERIRASHKDVLGLPPLEFVENHPEVVEEIERIILETYGQKGVEIYHKLCQNASGFYPRQGFEVGRDIESLEALQPHPETTEPTESERTQAPAKESAPKNEEEKQEMKNRITDWLSEENLKWAEGKTREEIFEKFGNELQPIAVIPDKYLKIFR